MKKILTLFLCAAMVLCMSIPAFADTATVPVKAAFSAQAISFDVSESVTATTTTSDPTTITFTSLTVENKMSAGSIDITSIVAEGQNGYTVVADSDETWVSLPFNTKKLSVVASIDTVSHDLSGGYTGTLNLAYGASKTITLSGHTAAVNEAITNTTVANIVTTVALHTV